MHDRDGFNHSAPLKRCPAGADPFKGCLHEAPREGAAELTSMLTWLEALVAAKGSDLHLKVGSPPRMRVDGSLVVLDRPSVTPETAEGLLREVIRPDLLDQFQQTNEADFAYSLPRVGRSGSTPSASAARSGWCCAGSRRGRCPSPSWACPR